MTLKLSKRIIDRNLKINDMLSGKQFSPTG